MARSLEFATKHLPQTQPGGSRHLHLSPLSTSTWWLPTGMCVCVCVCVCVRSRPQQRPQGKPDRSRAPNCDVRMQGSSLRPTTAGPATAGPATAGPTTAGPTTTGHDQPPRRLQSTAAQAAANRHPAADSTWCTKARGRRRWWSRRFCWWRWWSGRLGDGERRVHMPVMLRIAVAPIGRVVVSLGWGVGCGAGWRTLEPEAEGQLQWLVRAKSSYRRACSAPRCWIIAS
mmetsp:Transcript_19497/g.57793  ORF Transcript_19497/g.57793 Transcript_19497/m.57793 type:complete len:229 (+) Transcript_19497:856-1542(+)